MPRFIYALWGIMLVLNVQAEKSIEDHLKQNTFYKAVMRSTHYYVGYIHEKENEMDGSSGISLGVMKDYAPFYIFSFGSGLQFDQQLFDKRYTDFLLVQKLYINIPTFPFFPIYFSSLFSRFYMGLAFGTGRSYVQKDNYLKYALIFGQQMFYKEWDLGVEIKANFGRRMDRDTLADNNYFNLGINLVYPLY